MRHKIVFYLFIFLLSLVSSNTYAQVQLGSDINGDNMQDLTGTAISFSLDGNRLAISSPGSDNNTGKVQVYEWSNEAWVQIGADLTGVTTGNQFGVSVALSGDGNRLAVVAQSDWDFYFELGLISVYEWDGANWILTTIDITGDDKLYEPLKISISFASNSDRLVVTEQSESFDGQSGKVQVYELKENDWVKIGEEIQGQEDFNKFGSSTAISSDGNRLMIGNPLKDLGPIDDSGEIKNYEWQDNNWEQLGSPIRGIQEDSEIGSFAAMSSDGNIIAYAERIVSTLEGNFFIVKAIQWNGSQWIQATDEFIPALESQSIIQDHLRMTISGDGNILAIGDPLQNVNGMEKGKILIYQRQENKWIQIGESIVGNSIGDKLGSQLVLSKEGNRLAIASQFIDDNGDDSGQVRVYAIDTSTSTSSLAKSDMIVYPNPTQGLINLKATNITQADLFDSFGRLIKMIPNPTQQMDFSNLSQGVYFLQLHLESSIQTVRFIKE